MYINLPAVSFFPSCLNCCCSNYTYSLICYFQFTFTFMKYVCFDNANKYTYEDRYVFIPIPPSGLKCSIMLLNTRCQPSRHYIFKRGNRFNFWCLSCCWRSLCKFSSLVPCIYGTPTWPWVTFCLSLSSTVLDNLSGTLLEYMCVYVFAHVRTNIFMCIQ